jgi:hypothetical protein
MAKDGYQVALTALAEPPGETEIGMGDVTALIASSMGRSCGLFETDFVKPGKNVCYSEATVSAGGKAIARAHAMFKSPIAC